VHSDASRELRSSGSKFNARSPAAPIQIERISKMKKTLLSVAAAVALAASVPAFAQQAGVAIPKNTFFKGQAVDQYLVRDRLIGNKVYNKDGQIIGDIEDVIVNSGNQVEGIIMGVGGFLGAGEKKVGVRYSALQRSTKDGKTTWTLPVATKEVLAALEPYKRAEPKKSLVERAREKAKELTDKTKESAGPALEKAKEATKGAYEKAKEATSGAIEKGKEMIDTAKEKAAPTAPVAPTPKQ
jgi:sporulation protein YlmC with PRC-barrel domain